MTTVEPAEELGIATAIGSTFQVTIQHADNKAALITVMLSGIVTALVSQQDQVVTMLRGGGPEAIWLTGSLVVAGLALVITGLGLAGTVWPRLSPAAPGNHFAFPAVAGARELGLRGATIEDLCLQAWALNRSLATIATAKHRRVTVAIFGTAVFAVTTIAGLALSASTI